MQICLYFLANALQLANTHRYDLQPSGLENPCFWPNGVQRTIVMTAADSMTACFKMEELAEQSKGGIFLNKSQRSSLSKETTTRKNNYGCAMMV
jgi:hypothetical protein